MIGTSLDEEGNQNRWLPYEAKLRRLMGLAARRAIDAGYRKGTVWSHHGISTCLAEDAAPLARVLVEVWDGDTTGLERLHDEWGGNG